MRTIKLQIIQVLFFTAFMDVILFMRFDEMPGVEDTYVQNTIMFSILFFIAILMNFAVVLIPALLFRTKANNYDSTKERISHILNFKLKDIRLFNFLICLGICFFLDFIVQAFQNEQLPTHEIIRQILFYSFLSMVVVSNSTEKKEQKN